MKTWVVIPARYASTRFPGKPLAMILGLPLLQRVVERAREIRGLAGIMVATDDQRIFDLAKSLDGVQVAMTDVSHNTGTDRILQAIENTDCDLVINLQGDEPLINPKWIENLIQLFEKQADLNMATLAHPIREEELNSLNAVKVILNQNQEAIYFSRFAIPFSRSPYAASQKLVYKHIGIYAFRKSFLKKFCSIPQSELEKAESLEQLRAVEKGERIKVLLVEGASVGVDVPEDVQRVEALIGKV